MILLIKIINFKLLKRSLIIWNAYGIHREEPIFKKNFIKKNVLFQVDSEIENSEPFGKKIHSFKNLRFVDYLKIYKHLPIVEAEKALKMIGKWSA